MFHFGGMRLRLPELLTQHEVTAYTLAQRSRGRISPSTLYRLVRSRGRVRYLDGDLLDALCDVLDLAPGDLLERESKPKAGPVRRRLNR
jgi:DNA-binding Xre family transcriptional regulator